MRSYLVKFGLFVTLLAIANYLIILFLGDFFKPVYSLIILSLFSMSSLSGHFALKPSKSKPQTDQAFIRIFMLTTFLKLMYYLLIVVILFMFFKSDAKSFLVLFLIHYLVFTAFDTAWLYSHQPKR
jgi:hypothetical protein